LQVAARLNYNVIQINFDGHILRSDLIGEIKLEKGETKFRYGLVPYAFQEPGTILLLDEVDAVAPETAFVLQRAVSHDRTLLMLETSELIKLHPQNRIVATANTKGAGDETGMYQAGTNVQNFSFMNRWQTFIEVDYLSEGDEAAILKNMFPTVSKEHITGVVRTMSAARISFKAGQIAQPLTTRDSINWVKKLTKSSAPLRMAKYTFLNRMSKEDAIAIAQIIQRNFKLPENDDKSLIKK
jgi:cobaltochelatase CobS